MLKGVREGLYENENDKILQKKLDIKKEKSNSEGENSKRITEIAKRIKEKVDNILTSVKKDNLEIEDIEKINKEGLKEVFNLIELYDNNRELFLESDIFDSLDKEISMIVEILCKKDNVKNFINFNKEAYKEEYFENNIIEEDDEFYDEHLENVLIIIKEIEETLADKAIEDLNKLLISLKSIKDNLNDLK